MASVFLDGEGRTLRGCGDDLGRTADIDMSGAHPAIKEISFTVMSDVENPLLGKQGAAYTFGEQKGATGQDLESLEKGMEHYAEIVVKKTGKNRISGKRGQEPQEDWVLRCFLFWTQN